MRYPTPEIIARRAASNVRGRGACLPEHKTFPDTGCPMHPTCLGNDDYPACPLPYCRYDDPAQEQIARTYERWAKIMELREQGLSTTVIAKAAGCSERTVYRVLDDGLGAAEPNVPADSHRYQDTRALVDALQHRPPLVRLSRPPTFAVPGGYRG